MPTETGDTILIITSPDAGMPDGIYDDTPVESITRQLHNAGDRTHTVGPAEFIVPAGVFTAAALFVRTPCLKQAREYVQKHVSHHGRDKTEIDNYIQYLPMAAGLALDFTGVHSRHALLDRTLLLALGYATFGVTNFAAKSAFREQRPDSYSRNSFPSGHTGTVFLGAEFFRREYWHKSKWLAMSGYAIGIGVGYMRIHNDRHWINDVVGGAALGYLSCTFAYWLYPRLFHRRAELHRDRLIEPLLPERTKPQRKQLSWMAAPFMAAEGAGLSAAVVF